MVGETYEARTRLKVWKVKAGQRFVGRLLRDSPLGHITHWLGKGSVLCPGSMCPACLAGTGARWVGLMPLRLCDRDGGGRPVLIEFSGDAWARCGGLLHSLGHTDNRGVMVELSRITSRGGLIVEPRSEPGEESVTEMPEWVLLDAMATLYHLGRCLEGWTREQWVMEVQDAARMLVGKALREHLAAVA